MSDGYTVKELVQEVRADNKIALAQQSAILARLENIDGHLDKLNSKVATHEKKLYTLTTFQTKVMTVWAFIIVGAGMVVNKVLANFGI